MAKVTSVTFKGKSGTEYAFDTYTKDTAFNDISAVYSFVKRFKNTTGGYTQTPLYIGESEQLGTRIASHEKWPCADKNGCTHISVMAIKGEKARLAAETDLINGYDPVCNKQ
ncbi:hypothetical protein DA2_3180 [Desulfovibrio sp. A2]|nr:hypothetical protein DA2_3180 [Desulfovibrio sp. A2]